MRVLLMSIVSPAPLRRAFLRALLATTAIGLPGLASAQDASFDLPTVTVQAGQGGSLTVLSAQQARETINLTPGGVEIVTEQAWQDTPATTIKDMLDYVPGVFAQPKWGEDTRLSIRGSGISRNAHMRGILLYQDGIPLSAADGGGDFQELDPTAYQYVEVFKGANGYQYGANALGGAINFVSPTGRSNPGIGGRLDGGSFGFGRIQANAGGVNGAFDGYVTGSYLTLDGYRQHSAGTNARGSANFGWQPTDTLETRFYFNATDVQQEIPGAVSKTVALNSPQSANPTNIALDYQRNIQSVRVANKTTFLLSDTTKVDAGLFYTDKSLVHPIFQVLDYGYEEYGAFGRIVDERTIGGFDNRLVVGVNYGTGTVDAQRYTNVNGNAARLVYLSTDEATTTTVYAEDNFYVLPDLALVGAFQYLNASRGRIAYLGTVSGGNDYQLFLPKGGFVWEIGPDAQFYGNVSRSGEVPTFSELTNFAVGDIANLEAQTATTVEFGSRGTSPTFNWDVSLYRSWVQNELQCQDTGVLMGLTCTVVNLSDTIHQGLEVGANWSLFQGLFTQGAAFDSVWLNLAYTYSDFFFDNDPVWGDNQLPGIPRHYIRAELLYKHPAGFFAGPNVEWVPTAYYVDDANTLNTSPYALLNFKAGYEPPGGRFFFYVDARNLFNVNYIASVNVTALAAPNQALFEPGNGRAVYVGTKVSF
ncbi:TonB-dependent receptor family protein [Aquabacter spiritensis]|uniref:Iron complex outermembrane receptor protein n=1 Tax=Aquabacter spiritensis TaxID=933073 RepID=A0A4R3LSJ0_9HYPH|nr:TonB-dependent receptor [Aquabacter spiritensis]TCT03492.1 iron complex outermembrane receptor protein [Aquabacter spiritensis]